MGKSGGIMSSKEENKESDNQARQQKPKKQRIKNLVQAEDYFGPQYNKTSELPNPEASLQLLATGVVEVKQRGTDVVETVALADIIQHVTVLKQQLLTALNPVTHHV